jgi:arylsulfatase A
MEKPNIIVMLMDNLGYGDIGCYGSTVHRTPNLDQMAREGIRLTSFYSTSGVCTPSRSSMMTGCYPRRVNMHENCEGRCVLFPNDAKGLHPDEITVARLLREQGYATACIGKWHLGDQDPFLPTRHGFDEFFGCPYSEDMVPRPSNPDWPPLPLMRGDKVVEAPADRDYLTKRYTEESIRFIRENQDRPFFLYLPQAMPGSTPTAFSSPDFQGVSANGRYGDCVEELDWSAGEILKTLKELNLDERTLVIWTSDNGAVGWDPPQGSNLPLRGWGYDTSEGGQRMPCIARWPGRIPAGVERDDLTTMMDILPTAVRLGGGQPPKDRIIDGQDMLGILSNELDARSSYDDRGFFYYYMHQLQAVRSGPWKLYLPLKEKLNNLRGQFGNCPPAELELYDVRNDLSETQEVSARHPDVVERLLALADTARADLGDSDCEGSGQRPAGWVDAPKPQLLV